jgi:hypothetical protein
MCGRRLAIGFEIILVKAMERAPPCGLLFLHHVNVGSFIKPSFQGPWYGLVGLPLRMTQTPSIRHKKYI